MDFVSDPVAKNQGFGTLTVIDQCSRESLGLRAEVLSPAQVAADALAG